MSDIIGRDRKLGMVHAAHAYFNAVPIGTHWYWDNELWRGKEGYENAPEEECPVDMFSHPDLVAAAKAEGREISDRYGLGSESK
jgi:hypothetical protein